MPPSEGGRVWVDFMKLKNNPVRSGDAVVSFGLSKSDRVTLKIYDGTESRP